MNKEYQTLLRLVLPVLAINLLSITTIHAADDATEKTTKNILQAEDMPAAPAGPYRSSHDEIKKSESQILQRQPVSKPMPLHSTPNFNNRQWTTPTPPQWSQAQPQQKTPMHAPQWHQSQPRQQMPMSAPQWHQSQPQQQMPMPVPLWNQAQPQRRMLLPAPQWQQAQPRMSTPQWNQPQQRMPMPAPQWHQVQPQQRLSAPVPQWHQAQQQQQNQQQWNQQRPVFQQPFVPNSQYRRW